MDGAWLAEIAIHLSRAYRRPESRSQATRSTFFYTICEINESASIQLICFVVILRVRDKIRLESPSKGPKQVIPEVFIDLSDELNEAAPS